MSNPKKITFIVNPISGVGKQRMIEKVIENELKKSMFTSSVVYTEYAGHAIELAKSLAKTNDIVVAVGGDGSVNEVASGLLESNCTMGIIPTGSGNGLARTLGIPLNVKKAIQSINTCLSEKIDVVQCGERISLCAAGFGFDALISHRFATLKTRGFWSYVRLGLSSYFSYQPKNFEVIVDNKQLTTKNNLILSVANANQYGNDIFISPSANLFDGRLRLIALEKAPWYKLPYLFYCLRTNQLNKFKGYLELEAERLTIFNPSELGHVDGEPINTGKSVTLNILPSAINVLKP